MDRITTGIDALDMIVGGGLPAGSMIVIGGAPGTGKTILAQQIAFANATDQRPARYYTTLSEPHGKLIRHLEPFDFFDRSALDGRIRFINLTELAQGVDRERGLDAIVEEVVDEAFEEMPSVVVLDSSKALHHFADDARLRETIFSLAGRVAHTGAVLILVGEYDTSDFEDSPEFAVADGILHVANQPHGPIDRRWLRVIKMRGSDYLTGQHTFRIGQSGYEVFPRLETTAPSELEIRHGRAPFGVDGVDEMTGGGIPTGDAGLIMGPSGSGKTLLCCHWTAAGIAAGERCLYVTLEETEAELVEKARAFGLGFDDALAQGQLRILHVPPMELEIDEFGGTLQRHVADIRPSRVVVDALGDLIPAARAAKRFPSYLRALSTSLRDRGATTMLTYEVTTLGASAPRLDALSYLVQDVIVLRYMTRGAELGRVLTVLKMRRSEHDKRLLQYEIDGSGFRPLERLTQATGVLDWNVLGSPMGD